MKLAELYQSVTDTIIRDLEAGVAPWTKPWKSTAGGILPFNAVTKRGYNGINIPILWHAASVRGYASQGWLTYKQAAEAGAQVRGGERGTTVVFTKRLTVGEEDDERKISMLRTFTVFNEAQVDGLPVEPANEGPPLAQSNVLADAEYFIAGTKADIRIGGDRACYLPALDFVALPPIHAFNAPAHYYATALHELGHWTGHKTRLNRDLKSRFDRQAYAAEELIAELTAAFLCAFLGIEGQLRHADYIGHWIALLKEDDRAIFTAASKAQAAADYLRAFSQEQEEANAA